MLIKSAQIEALGSVQKEKFIDKTIVFLKKNTPEWAEFKTDEQIAAYVKSMIELGKEREIKTEINIQKLLYQWIKYELQMPPSDKIEAELNQDNKSENYRVKSMIKAISKNGIR